MTFQKLLALNPELTSVGFVSLDDPDYARTRLKLVNSEVEFRHCVNWLQTNRKPRFVEHSLQWCNVINLGCPIYIGQGPLIAAVLVLGLKHKRDGNRLRFR